MINAKLGFGPMSTEIIEAIFRYSHYYRKELMIIPSKNQIDHSGGYVNGWTTHQFVKFINEMKEKYPMSNIKLCRDHCGPGFNGVHDLNDVYQTIETDIKNGFHLIHIDFCLYKGSKDKMLEESKKAIEYCLSLNPNILIEVGTDENLGMNFTTNEVKVIEKEINFFKSFCDPIFYVVQTGSLVREISQVGSFNKSFIEKVICILRKYNLKLKEHNADYLSKQELIKRRGLVDAMNIAPQLGVVQTNYVLNKCLLYGIKFDTFMNEVYNGKRWEKWMYKNEPNKLLCTLIAGHYHFNSNEYKLLIDKLKEHEDVKENIIECVMNVINHYDENC